MKKKILVFALSLAMLAALACAGVGAGFAAADREYSSSLTPVAEMGDNGVVSTYNGMEVRVGIYNRNFYRGKDADGNYFFQPMQESTGATGNGTRFMALSDKKMYLDGYTLRFRIDPLYADSKIGTGANWTFGLGCDPTGTLHPWVHSAVSVAYNAERKDFDFYFVSANNNVWPLPLGGEAAGIEIGQYAMKDGDRDFVRPTFGGEVCIQFRKLTKTEAAERGITNAVNPEAYYLFLNNHLVNIPQRGSNTPNLEAFLPNWTGQLALPQDDGGYYGYFYYYDNVMSVDGAGFPAVPADTDRDARVTFSEMQGNGSDGGEIFDNAADPLPEADGEGFRYNKPSTGEFAGKTVLTPSGENGFSAALAAKTKLSAAEADFTLMDVGYSPVGTKSSIFFKSAPGKSLENNHYFGLDLVKCEKGLEVILVVDGKSYPTAFTAVSPFPYQFRDEAACNVEASADGLKLALDGRMIELSDEALAAYKSSIKEFANLEGYIRFASEQKLAIGTIVTDGTAVTRFAITSIVSALPDLAFERDTAIADVVKKFPATLTLEASDGSPITAHVAWTHQIATGTPNVYEVSGVFSDLAELEQRYRVGSNIKNLLRFSVTVNFESDYAKYGSTDYSAAGSRWESFGGGKNDFAYYEDEDGYEHMISLVTEGKNQFMPGNTTKMDIDGYSFRFKFLNLKGTAEFKLLFLSAGGAGQHPMEAQLGGSHFGICVSKADSAGTAALLRLNYGNYNNSNGHADLKTDVVGIVKDNAFVEAVPFDWTGETEYEISLKIENGNINIYFSDGQTKYLVVTGVGQTQTQPAMTALVNSRFPGDHDKMYSMIWHETGFDEAVFLQTYNRYIVDYAAPAAKIVGFHSEHGLPSTVKATLNTGEVVDVDVAYAGEYDKTKAGEYLLTGTVSSKLGLGDGKGGDITDGPDETFKVRVTVKQQIFTIKSFEKQSSLNVKVGETPVFPTKFKVQIKDGVTNTTSEKEIEVVWTSADFNTLTPGTYTFRAQAVGNYVFDSSVSDQIEITVRVEGKTQGGCGADASDAAGVGGILLLAGLALAGKRMK